MAIQTIQLIPDAAEAQRVCRQLMDKHGLQEWTLKITRNKRTVGTCYTRRRVIAISIYQPDGDYRETCLHEIAHALTPTDRGHGNLWRLKCLEIGAKPMRSARIRYGEGIGWRSYCTECNAETGQSAGKRRVIERYVSRCCKAAIRQEKG